MQVANKSTVRAKNGYCMGGGEGTVSVARPSHASHSEMATILLSESVAYRHEYMTISGGPQAQRSRLLGRAPMELCTDDIVAWWPCTIRAILGYLASYVVKTNQKISVTSARAGLPTVLCA